MNSSSGSRPNPPFTIQSSFTPPLEKKPSHTDRNIDKIAQRHLVPVQKLSAYEDMRQRIKKRAYEEKSDQQLKERRENPAGGGKKEQKAVPDLTSSSNRLLIPARNQEDIRLVVASILLSMSAPIRHPLPSMKTSFESLSDFSFEDEIDGSSSANRNKNTPILEEDPFRFDDTPFDDLKDIYGKTPFKIYNKKHKELLKKPKDSIPKPSNPNPLPTAPVATKPPHLHVEAAIPVDDSSDYDSFSLSDLDSYSVFKSNDKDG